MASPPKSINLIHKNDPKWIIELWLAIHGGDPAPELHASTERVSRAASEAIKALAHHLDPAKARAVTAALGH